MSRKDDERYEIDPQDGLKREIIGEWSAEKHERLRRYVEITTATRRKYRTPRNAYIDLYCATGRARVRGNGRVVAGSAIIAATSHDPPSGFDEIYLGDLEQDHLDACEQRLHSAGAKQKIHAFQGRAEETASEVRQRIDRYGLHLAFLDPYSISALPFAVIEVLAAVPRLDLLIHLSENDLQRNVIGKREFHRLDPFVPGWQKWVDPTQPPHIVKRQILQGWRANIEQLGFKVSDNIERVTGEKNQPLYWLLLASRHDLANKFWKAVSRVSPQIGLGF